MPRDICQHLDFDEQHRAQCVAPGFVAFGELTASVCESCEFHQPTTVPLDPQLVREFHALRLTPQTPIPVVEDSLQAPPTRRPDGYWEWENVQQAFRNLTDQAIADFVPHDDVGTGRGIVVVGGGRYLVSAYVTIRVLRHVGCDLPIELWHLDDEVDAHMEQLLLDQGAVCRNAEEHHRQTQSTFRFMPNWQKGWQLKAYALTHCGFDEILLLDADSYPTRDPAFLFDCPTYVQTGSVFCPDTFIPNAEVNERVGRAFGFVVDDEVWAESGQMMIHKSRCQRELALALHYNSLADFTYRIVYGDKDTFPLAWRRLGTPFGRLWPRCGSARKSIVQLDEQGHPLFQHRIHDKFRLTAIQFDSTRQLSPGNSFIPELQHEIFCNRVLHQLRKIWKPEDKLLG
ncbi:MAG: hypothetical protein KDA58_07355 [Planctomycetaceae bacterium]|nr:hypothetical protein [Planctomycetaceae bacterium]